MVEILNVDSNLLSASSLSVVSKAFPNLRTLNIAHQHIEEEVAVWVEELGKANFKQLEEIFVPFGTHKC